MSCGGDGREVRTMLGGYRGNIGGTPSYGMSGWKGSGRGYLSRGVKLEN